MSDITKVATTYTTTHPRDAVASKEITKTVTTFGFNKDGEWVIVNEVKERVA